MCVYIYMHIIWIMPDITPAMYVVGRPSRLYIKVRILCFFGEGVGGGELDGW